jgi:hypothetical protein
MADVARTGMEDAASTAISLETNISIAATSMAMSPVMGCRPAGEISATALTTLDEQCRARF